MVWDQLEDDCNNLGEKWQEPEIKAMIEPVVGIWFGKQRGNKLINWEVREKSKTESQVSALGNWVHSDPHELESPGEDIEGFKLILVMFNLT